jgi:hypothetical protein
MFFFVATVPCYEPLLQPLDVGSVCKFVFILDESLAPVVVLGGVGCVPAGFLRLFVLALPIPFYNLYVFLVGSLGYVASDIYPRQLGLLVC